MVVQTSWVAQRKLALERGFTQKTRNPISKFWFQCQIYNSTGRFIMSYKANLADLSEQEIIDRAWQFAAKLRMLPEK